MLLQITVANQYLAYIISLATAYYCSQIIFIHRNKTDRKMEIFPGIR